MDLPTHSVAPNWRGVLEHIHIAEAASLPMCARSESTIVAGVGIPDDRYATRTGTYSDRHHIDRQVTLIETETLEALHRDRGLTLAPHEHRRNLTTRGVPLAHLVGRDFTVGPCGVYGGRRNVPCKYLENLLQRPVFRPLINRSGLNARVIVGGLITVGDSIEPCHPDEIDPTVRAANEQIDLEAPPEVF